MCRRDRASAVPLFLVLLREESVLQRPGLQVLRQFQHNVATTPLSPSTFSPQKKNTMKRCEVSAFRNGLEKNSLAVENYYRPFGKTVQVLGQGEVHCTSHEKVDEWTNILETRREMDEDEEGQQRTADRGMLRRPFTEDWESA